MNQYNEFLVKNVWGLLIIAIWSLFWKCYSLWIASKNDQKKWFMALLVFNTLGILEIIYVFYFAKKKWSDVKEVFSKSFWSKKE